MNYVGIDIAKNKHECFIMDSNGAIILESWSFENNYEGFNSLKLKLQDHCKVDECKIGLEATGTYGDALIKFLYDQKYKIYLINPLHSNNFRKGQSLRKTKTDTIDAKILAIMLVSLPDLKPITENYYNNSELKRITRLRNKRVKDRAKLKTELNGIINTMFPEFLHMFKTGLTPTSFKILSEFENVKEIADCHLTRLANVVSKVSGNKYGKSFAVKLKKSAQKTIGNRSNVLFFEALTSINLIFKYDELIKKLDEKIKEMMEELNAPSLSIPGIGINTLATIYAEVKSFSNFASADQLLAYSGFSPSTYQSGELENCHSHMEKRGSKYLRQALYNAARHVAMYDKKFKAYLNKKLSEGKHYFVAISHTVKKLLRVMFALETRGEEYIG